MENWPLHDLTECIFTYLKVPDPGCSCPLEGGYFAQRTCEKDKPGMLVVRTGRTHSLLEIAFGEPTSYPKPGIVSKITIYPPGQPVVILQKNRIRLEYPGTSGQPALYAEWYPSQRSHDEGFLSFFALDPFGETKGVSLAVRFGMPGAIWYARTDEQQEYFTSANEWILPEQLPVASMLKLAEDKHRPSAAAIRQLKLYQSWSKTVNYFLMPILNQLTPNI